MPEVDQKGFDRLCHQALQEMRISGIRLIVEQYWSNTDCLYVRESGCLRLNLSWLPIQHDYLPGSAQSILSLSRKTGCNGHQRDVVAVFSSESGHRLAAAFNFCNYGMDFTLTFLHVSSEL